MARHSLWPKGLTGRVILVLVLAVLFQFLAGSVLIRTGEMHIQRQDLGRRVAEQVLIAERIITAADRSDRSRLLKSLSTIHTKLELVEGSPEIGPGIDAEAREIANAIFEFEPALANYELRLSLETGSFLNLERKVIGAIEIDEDTWIGFTTQERVADWRLLLETSIRGGLIAVLILGSA
ncbi:MAG TPA: hypothetical protein DCF81_05565, partial [Erythrobacter sp.]|nr:hypothetical protein [Erythrobacter sp.]